MANEGEYPKADDDVLYGSEANYGVGNVCFFEAGENITAGNIVYIHLTDGKAYVSDTGTANDIRANGIAETTATTGNAVEVRTGGAYTTSGLTAKADYYLGASGALTTTVGSVRIGTAVATTLLFVQIIQDDRDAVQTIKAWHKAMTGGITELNAFWKECDGQTLSDAESPLNGEDVPDLNANALAAKYLVGNATSGTANEGPTHVHKVLHQTGSNYYQYYASDGVTLANWAITDRDAQSGGTDAIFERAATASIYSQAQTSTPPNFTVVWIMKVK